MSLEERVERARRLLAAIEKNHSPTALASSFGAEDMVVLDLIARDGLAIEIFTLDTGRLPRETHALIADVRKRYGLAIVLAVIAVIVVVANGSKSTGNQSSALTPIPRFCGRCACTRICFAFIATIPRHGWRSPTTIWSA